MSDDFTFSGTFELESPEELARALEQIRALLKEEDDDFRAIITDTWDECFRVEGARVQVLLSIGGPSDWWFSAETIVSTLAKRARSGHVEARQDGEAGGVRYLAGGDEEEFDEDS